MGMRETDLALIEVLNQALARLMADGTLERILARYGITYQPPFPET
jgi:ABC-type amino acid transport substrate-binding protein